MSRAAPVAVCSRSFAAHPTLRERLLERWPAARFPAEGAALEGEALVAHLRGCERAIVSLQRVDGALLDRVPELRVIAKFGVGLDGIDQDALATRGVRLAWQGGVNRRAVAELAVGLAIALLRGVHRSDRDVRAGGWRPVVGRELGASTLGILGCGHIGKELVRLVRPWGCRLLAHDRLDFPEFYAAHGVRPVDLDTLLAESDVLSVHLPLDASTAGILSRDRLAAMRPGACLVNTARGGLVDEQALAGLLAAGHLSGAAFDVFADEPPLGSPLLDQPGFLATAHIGGSSEQGILAMGLAALEGLEDP